MDLGLSGSCRHGRGSVFVEAPLDSVRKSSSVCQNISALIHDPLHVGLGVAVEFNDGSVKSLHFSLSVEAVLKIVDVLSQLFDICFICTSLPVILKDLLFVESNLLGVLINFFFGPFDS